MQCTLDSEILKNITKQLMHDLTKALKLFKTRLSLLLKLTKQPFEDFKQIISQTSQEEIQLINKYQQIDKKHISSFHMQFQRLFCRIIQMVQTEKKNVQLQNYVTDVQTIIYRTIADKQSDYICALANIYGKGRLVIKTIQEGQIKSIKSTKIKATFVSVSKVQKKQTKQKNTINHYSTSLKLLTGLDLDLNYRRDSLLYIPSHQDETYLEMNDKNKTIASDINFYKRMYTQNINKRQRKLNQKYKKIIQYNLSTTSETNIKPILTENPEEMQTQGDEKCFSKLFNKTGGSFRTYQPFSLSKENKKYQQQRKTSYSFRQTQTQIKSRQLTPKKIFFCFNNLSFKSDEAKPIQLNIKRKNKQIYQTKIKLKQSLLDIVIQGRKIQDQQIDVKQCLKKVSFNSNLFI